jgi:hypothetical protein
LNKWQKDIQKPGLALEPTNQPIDRPKEVSALPVSEWITCSRRDAVAIRGHERTLPVLTANQILTLLVTIDSESCVQVRVERGEQALDQRPTTFTTGPIKTIKNWRIFL